MPENIHALLSCRIGLRVGTTATNQSPECITPWIYKGRLVKQTNLWKEERDRYEERGRTV